jgi:prepilin-type N-terminal cleavage/methylation domain-containing protein
MRGFTIIEILVALVVFTVVILSCLGFVAFQLKKERETGDLIKAAEIAQSKIEEVLLPVKVTDSEEIVGNQYLVRIKVLDGDQSDEPRDREPLEIRISVINMRNRLPLVEISALK